MRNANDQDVARAKATGKLEENVMYAWGFSHEDVQFVHGKKIGDLIPEIIADYYQFEGKQITICETADGVLHTCNIAAIGPVEKKGPAQQPKKTRRKPVKGTKPETKIPMSADVKLEVGDVVLVNSKGITRRAIVAESDGTGTPYRLSCKQDTTQDVDQIWFYTRGVSNINDDVFITHKIIPYQEPAKEEKSPEQEAFEAGYWVPFAATATSACPEWAKDVPTTIKMRDGTESLLDGVICGDGWEWDNAQEEGTIVAYRKAQR